MQNQIILFLEFLVVCAIHYCNLIMIINYLFAVNGVFSWVIVPILKDINVLIFLTNGVYISRHVTFDEHVFPAKDIYSATPP